MIKKSKVGQNLSLVEPEIINLVVTGISQSISAAHRSKDANVNRIRRGSGIAALLYDLPDALQLKKICYDGFEQLKIDCRMLDID